MTLFDITKYRHYLGNLPELLLQGDRERSENPLEESLVFDMLLDGELLQYPPVVTISVKKNVVITKINGNNTLNVVEHIGGLSYEIKIMAFMENTIVHEVEKAKASRGEQVTEVINALQSFSPKLIKSTNNGLYLKDNQFPIELLGKIVNLFRKNKSLKVEHDILNKAFSIYQLVLTSFDNIVFYPTAFSFQLTAIADKPIELLL